MSRFKILTETLAEIHYWNNEDVEIIIEAHFKMWLTTEIQNRFSGKLQDERQYLIEQKQELLQKRQAIECQSLIAKSELREGKKVDTKWLARLNWAGKMTGAQLVHIQDRLSEINKVQKRMNLEMSITRDKIILDNAKQWIFDTIGDAEKYKEKMSEFGNFADAVLNTPNYIYECKLNTQ